MKSVLSPNAMAVAYMVDVIGNDTFAWPAVRMVAECIGRGDAGEIMYEIGEACDLGEFDEDTWLRLKVAVDIVGTMCESLIEGGECYGSDGSPPPRRLLVAI